MQNNLQILHANNHTRTKISDIISGENLSVNNTVNDSAFIRINGKSVQNGTPTAASQIPINGVTNFDLISCGKNWFDINSTYTSQAGINTILDLPNNSISGLAQDGSTSYCFNNKILPYFGVCRYSAVFQGIPRLLIRLLDANKNNISNSITATGWTYNAFYNALHSGESRSAAFYTPNTNVKYVQFGFVFRSSTINARVSISNIQVEVGNIETLFKIYKGQTIHFAQTMGDLPDGKCDYIVIDNENKLAYYQPILNTKTLQAGSSWTLADAKPNSAFRCTAIMPGNLVGNTLTSPEPITSEFKVMYELAVKPEPVMLNYEAVKTYFSRTNIYTNASVQPTMNGKFRVIGGLT